MADRNATIEGPTARDIEDALRQRVDSLVPELLPNARRDGHFWCAGSVAGDAGQSLKVNRNGPMQGTWADFSAAEGTDDRGGDMLKLICVVHFGGWRRGKEAQSKAIAWAKDWLGWENIDRDRLEKIKRETSERQALAEKLAIEEAAGKRRSALAMWAGASPIAGTAAEQYLIGRGINLRAMGHVPGSLRFLPDCWCSIRRGKYPAMIAGIMLLDEPRPVAVHRTYLDVSAGRTGLVKAVKVIAGENGKSRIWDGREAGKVKSYKLTLATYEGGCIPLWKGSCKATLRDIAPGTPVYVSEGIEDGLTIAQARPEARVVAGVSLSNMGKLQLPPQAGPLIFIGQHDPVEGKAVEAFERVIARQQILARAAQRPDPQIIWPDPRFKDFNDQLLGKELAR